MTTNQSSPEQVQAVIMAYLEEVLNMEIRLGDDDDVYDIGFISQKLHLCSKFSERAAHIMISLTKINIEVTGHAAATLGLSKTVQSRLKASPEYGELPMRERSDWLSNRVEGERQAAEKWQLLRSAVSQVKEAVADRVSTLKRLDSDLRLQSRLLEAKVAAGATNPNSFGARDSGNNNGVELD